MQHRKLLGGLPLEEHGQADFDRLNAAPIVEIAGDPTGTLEEQNRMDMVVLPESQRGLVGEKRDDVPAMFHLRLQRMRSFVQLERARNTTRRAVVRSTRSESTRLNYSHRT